MEFSCSAKFSGVSGCGYSVMWPEKYLISTVFGGTKNSISTFDPTVRQSQSQNLS